MDPMNRATMNSAQTEPVEAAPAVGQKAALMILRLDIHLHKALCGPWSSSSNHAKRNDSMVGDRGQKSGVL